MADAQARKLPVRHREATTTDETTFTLTLDPDLRDRFVAEADATLRHADDVLRDLMRDFVARRHAARGDEVAAKVARAVQEADDPGTRRVPHRDARARAWNSNAMRCSHMRAGAWHEDRMAAGRDRQPVATDRVYSIAEPERCPPL